MEEMTENEIEKYKPKNTAIPRPITENHSFFVFFKNAGKFLFFIELFYQTENQSERKG